MSIPKLNLLRFSCLSLIFLLPKGNETFSSKIRVVQLLIKIILFFLFLEYTLCATSFNWGGLKASFVKIIFFALINESFIFIFWDLNLHFSIRFCEVSKFLKFKILELAFPLLKLNPIGFLFPNLLFANPSSGFFVSDLLYFLRLISSLNVSKSIIP